LLTRHCIELFNLLTFVTASNFNNFANNLQFGCAQTAESSSLEVFGGFDAKFAAFRTFQIHLKKLHITKKTNDSLWTASDLLSYTNK